MCGVRQPAADDLAEGGEVRLDAEVLLRAAVGDAEARHDLVEDKERALPAQRHDGGRGGGGGGEGRGGEVEVEVEVEGRGGGPPWAARACVLELVRTSGRARAGRTAGRRVLARSVVRAGGPTVRVGGRACERVCVRAARRGAAHFLVSSRSPSRKAWSGTMKPELPTTGSRMTPQISSLLAAKSALTLSRSLYLATRVLSAAPLVTPGEGLEG